MSERYVALADELGSAIATAGATLIYGGASVGLMGVVAQAVHRSGGRVIGIIPQSLVDREVAYHHADEMIITRDMRERKGQMEARADAFIALPGGIGTLEEVFEIMTLRHLEETTKPLILLNYNGFYDTLVAMLEFMRAERFVRDDHASLYHLAPTAAAAMALATGAAGQLKTD